MSAARRTGAMARVSTKGEKSSEREYGSIGRRFGSYRGTKRDVAPGDTI
jgi:hypothetical protein